MSTYCFSDLHAQYDLWKQIKEYIKPEDKVFCLGDCVDRGPAALEILNEVMNTPNITLLCGNHEDFISSIGSELIKYDDDEDIYWKIPTMMLWYNNGAAGTIKAFQALSLKERKNLIQKIKNLPTHIEYTNKKGEIIYLCHAGRQPDTKELIDTQSGDIPLNNYIWDRYHLFEKKWNGKENEYCVHGHTPICYLNHLTWFSENELKPQEYDKIYKYCEGHKINIDLGSFTTHTACLLNLDTWEPIYFKDESGEDN